MRTFEEILKDVDKSCNKILGYKHTQADVIDSATKIYIAELQAEKLKNSK